ncbi:MAG: TRAP transporter fused permease subunit [Trueperaceae bacterium]|nr:TRAP transporter fused permease subunit [Trueperaceae bacterium]
MDAEKGVAIPDERSTLPIGPVVAVIATVLGLALGAFQLYTAGYQPMNLFVQRGFHLSLILVLAFLIFPIGRRARAWWGWAIDGAFVAGSIYTGWYLIAHLDAIIRRTGFFTSDDVTAGIIATIVVLEASRRVIGAVITVVAGVFIIYAMAGPRGSLPGLSDYLPGILAHRGYDVDRIIAQLYLGQEGIFGLPLGVAATVVFTFILFGAFLETTGAGKFFIDMAYAAAGRARGGPAKAAVVASGFMGSISGSAIANVVTSGAFTIPLMKKLGYKPEEAGGIEAAASTGGQIMPPIMGAGAFLMAEYTGLPYADIVRLSVLPALLYFATVFLFVDIIAAKRGMTGLKSSELPRVGQVMKDGWYYLVPLGILIYFLLRDFSPNRVGFIAIVAIVIVAIVRWGIRRFVLRVAPDDDGPRLPVAAASVLGLRRIVAALETGARNAIPVTVACAVAGIVVGIIGLTGLGLKFSALMLTFSGGNLVLALFLLILASLVLGLGLPVTASYIVLAVLAAPALVNEFGIPLIIAHLVIFWYSQDSNVTPPVALAAFAAAGIANSDPMKTGFQAWKFAKGLYLIPLFLVYNPEMVTGGPLPYVIWTVLVAIVALFAFAAALEGFMFTRMFWLTRLLVLPGLVMIFYPSFVVEVAGLGIMLLVLAINFTKRRRERRDERVA